MDIDFISVIHAEKICVAYYIEILKTFHQFGIRIKWYEIHGIVDLHVCPGSCQLDICVPFI